TRYGPQSGDPHGETAVNGRRDLCERPEGDTSVLHAKDRPEGAIGDAEVGLSGPRRDEGRRGCGPYAVAAGAGVGPGDVRVPVEDDWRGHGDRLHHVLPVADGRGPEEEGREDRG